MDRNTFNRGTNLTLVPLSLLTLLTGIGLHGAGHGADSAVQHSWAVWHTLFSLSLLAVIALHLWNHRAWYRNVARIANRRRRNMVLVLTALFACVAVTGLSRWFCDGGHAGIFHYQTGLLLAVLMLSHLWGRRRSLKFGPVRGSGASGRR